MKTAFIEIDGRRFAWKELVRRRQAARRVAQPALFDLRDDTRPVHDRTAADRYREPSLLSLLSREG